MTLWGIDMGGFRFLEHVSDVLIEAWGETLEEAFKQAAKAFFETMVEVDKIEKRKTGPYNQNQYVHCI